MSGESYSILHYISPIVIQISLNTIWDDFTECVVQTLVSFFFWKTGQMIL